MRISLNLWRAVLALVACLMLAGAWAGVPNKDAVPAYGAEQTLMQNQSDARVPEPGLGDAASGKVHMDRHFLGQYGNTEANVIVQRGGNTWRVLRNGPFAAVSGTILLVVPLLIFGFYLAVGPARPERDSVGRAGAGRRLTRFSRWDRLVHWSVAISFLLLAFTGVLIMFGKLLFMPWMGHQLFAWLALLSKYVHNFVGPLFVAGSVIMFFTYLHRNFFSRIDWQWIKAGGGLVSHKHVPAGFFNAGEKAWFWLGVFGLGLVMSISGLVLDFVNFGQTRYVLQVASYFHIAGATLYMAAAMGHIYIGTLGTPGAYQAMREGTVDEAWARQHHQLWYDEVQQGGAPADPRRAPPAPGVNPGPAL